MCICVQTVHSSISWFGSHELRYVFFVVWLSFYLDSPIFKDKVQNYFVAHMYHFKQLFFWYNLLYFLKKKKKKGYSDKTFYTSYSDKCTLTLRKSHLKEWPYKIAMAWNLLDSTLDMKICSLLYYTELC